MALLLVATAAGAECPQVVGQWGYGRIHTVEVVDGFAYYGMGDDLVVADVSDPENPEVLGRIQLGLQAGGLSDLVAKPPYLFAVHSYFGLRVVDVHDPHRPAVIASLPMGIDGAFSVAREGDRLYLAGSYSLSTVDISQPEAPALLGTVDGGGWDVEVAGRYLYAAERSQTPVGLRIYDLEAGPLPVLVRYLEIPGAQAVRVAGDLLFVGGGGTDGFRVFSLADPASPVQVGACTLQDRVYAIEVEPDRHIAVTASRSAGMRVVSFADPAAPAEVGTYDPQPGYDFFDVERVGETVFCATWYGGLRAVDLDDPAHPREVGHYAPARYAYGLASLEGRLLVADTAFGLRVLEPGTGWKLEETGSLQNPWSSPFIDVTVVGGMPVLKNDGSMVTVSMEDPSRPAIMGRIVVTGTNLAGYGHHVLSGSHLFVEVVDVADPENPVWVGEAGLIPPPPYTGWVDDISVAGSRAFVSAWLAVWWAPQYPVAGALFILDLTVPEAPVELGRVVDDPGYLAAVTADMEYAYASRWSSILVVDVNGAEQPRVVAELDACGGNGMRLANGLLVAAQGDPGFGLGFASVCSVRDPTSPVLLGTYLTGGDGRDVEVVNGILYVADGPAGVIALSLADCMVVFSDGFESGDLSAWSPDRGGTSP